MPGSQHGPSIKNPKVYDALRRKGMSKTRAARISNAMANKDAGPPLHGPGGLLGVAGLGGRGRKWGNRRKDAACTCGIATKGEQIAPGITRIRGDLCNVHGRYGLCPGAVRKPKGGKGRKPRAARPKKPTVTPEQRAQERAAKRDAQRKSVIDQMANSDTGLAPAAAQALLDFSDGKTIDPAFAKGLASAGLAEQAADGSYRLTASGRMAAHAIDRGDYRGAVDAVSAGTDRAARQDAAGKKRAASLSERMQRATQAKKPKAGGGGKKPKTSAGDATRAQREQERQADRAQRQREHAQDRARSQAEHAADRAQRQRERSEDRQAQLDARRARSSGTSRPARVPTSRTPIVTRGVPNRGTTPRQRKPTKGGATPTRQRPTGKSFAVFKSADGSYRWLARTTTAYRDRDREILEIAALDADSQRMTAAKQYGPLRWWHVGKPNALDVAAPWGPGLDIGDCDFSMQIGTTRVESGTFKDATLAERVAANADQYELSPGFFHPYGPSGPPDGIYQQMRTFERSLVPTRYGRASNLFTGLTVKEFSMDPNEMERRFKAAIAELRLTSEQAEALAAGLVQADKSAADQGIAYKSDDAPQVFTAPDGTQGLIVDGHFVALKAAAPQVDTELMADDTMAEEQADVGDPAADDAGGEYIGDMTPAEFWAQLQQYLAPVLKVQEMHKAIGDMVGELKGMGQQYATKDASTVARIAALETELATLKGDQPAVVDQADIAAALKGAPSAPPDPNAVEVPNDPNRPYAAVAARTFPTLYQQNAQGGFAGWTPPPPSQS